MFFLSEIKFFVSCILSRVMNVFVFWLMLFFLLKCHFQPQTFYVIKISCFAWVMNLVLFCAMFFYHYQKSKRAISSYICLCGARLYKLLESGNGTIISDKKGHLVKPKYLGNKRWPADQHCTKPLFRVNNQKETWQTSNIRISRQELVDWKNFVEIYDENETKLTKIPFSFFFSSSKCVKITRLAIQPNPIK